MTSTLLPKNSCKCPSFIVAVLTRWYA
jgi:hypothetical protein